MALDNREAMAWALASFLSFVAWLSVAQVTLLGEQLRDLDLDLNLGPPNNPTRPRTPEITPLKRKQAGNGASSSTPKRRRSILLVDAPPPSPVMGTPRTALDIPLWVPEEFSREPHNRRLLGHSYRYGGVPPWEEDPTDEPSRDEFMRRGRLQSFWDLAWGRPRAERRRSWPPSTSMPKWLRPGYAGSLNDAQTSDKDGKFPGF